MSHLDFLVVGCGPTGATCARLLTDAGKKVLVIDKRGHYGGNVFDEEIDGILRCRYGAHISHSRSARIWNFLSQFTAWEPYEHRVLAHARGQYWSFPLNLKTFSQLWGCDTEAQARARMKREKIPCERPHNAKDWLLAQIGEELYETFYRGYTRKQWGRDPAFLPASIVRRIPIRFNWDDRYFDDPFQGMPRHGYTQMIGAMLEGIEVRLGEAYDPDRPHPWRVIYTGPLDALFEYQFGRLEYRSLMFKEITYPAYPYQPVATVNYPGTNVCYTRITEWRQFYPRRPAEGTTITVEWPKDCEKDDIPYYPVRIEGNVAIHAKYLELAKAAGIIPAGRLGMYSYLNIDQAVGAAMNLVEKLLQ